MENEDNAQRSTANPDGPHRAVPAEHDGTELFVYGTLRHDQPEHARFCRGVVGWSRASLRGSLRRLPSGYLVLVVDPGAVLLHATGDALVDETRRRALADSVRTLDSTGTSGWIEGEVLRFRDAAEAWPPLDRWEDFRPGVPGAYQRCVVPVRVNADVTSADQETRARMIAAWAYVASGAPAGSVAV
ncbi:gamma-glutamylcyclotransferase family protein [Congregicoccus parvus]|uniref:gamma-glutamylcyclotransferase family protein n=1 Tax=Congregicoccus parvus TaxID=3081749 RepID=UPI003FA57AEC